MSEEVKAPPSGPPPGWYPHPEMAQTLRYWDGSGWTGQVAPAAIAPEVDARKQAASIATLASFGWAGAILLPIGGIVVAVMLMAKDRALEGVAMFTLSVVMIGVWATLLY